MRITAWLMLVLGALLLAGCSGPARRDPFNRNRLGELARSVRSAGDAQEFATTQLLEAIEDLGNVGTLGLTPHQAYDRSRRHVAIVESRMRNAERRIGQADMAADSLFREWRAELRTYGDDAYEGTSRAKREELTARYESLSEALGAAQDAMPDVEKLLTDRMLFFKHRRDEPLATDPPLSDQGKAAMEKLRLATTVAVAECEQFVELITPRAPQAPVEPAAAPSE